MSRQKSFPVNRKRLEISWTFFFWVLLVVWLILALSLLGDASAISVRLLGVAILVSPMILAFVGFVASVLLWICVYKLYTSRFAKVKVGVQDQLSEVLKFHAWLLGFGGDKILGKAWDLQEHPLVLYLQSTVGYEDLKLDVDLSVVDIAWLVEVDTDGWPREFCRRLQFEFSDVGACVTAKDCLGVLASMGVECLV